MFTINEKELIGKDDLTNEDFFPLFRLVVCFQVALQEDDFEFCRSIQSEMERRQRDDLIDKQVLRRALDFIMKQPTNSMPEQEKCFINTFEKFC